jgi:hypothetical protein
MRKGQEEAPIELLLAVTLLTFVIVLGFYSYNNMCGSLYQQKMKDSFSSFASAMNSVYKGAISSSQVVPVDFSSAGCTQNIDSIRLLKGDPDMCLKNLGRRDCLQMVAVMKDSTGHSSTFALEMLSIPSTMTIELDNGQCDTSLNGIDYDMWNSASADLVKCTWAPRIYTIQITKTSSDKMTIKQLG